MMSASIFRTRGLRTLFRRSFFPLLGGRKEKQVLQLLTEHLDLVVEVVVNLKLLISLLVEENTAARTRPPAARVRIETKIEMISINESFADDVYLKSLVAICDGAFFSGLREDFIKLFDSIDDIADFAKGSSQILARSELGKFMKKLYEGEETSLVLFLDKIIKSVKILKEAVYELEKDVTEVIKKSIKVKELEEEADVIKWKLLKVLFSHKSEMDTLTLLELKEFVLTLDEIADAASRSSETLITIVTKARS